MIVCRQDSSATANADGEIPEDEQEVCTRWMEVRPLRGTERWLADQVQADVTHLVNVRYDTLTAAITPKYWLKLKYSGERLNVKRAYDPDLRRRKIEMECVERK